MRSLLLWGFVLKTLLYLGGGGLMFANLERPEQAVSSCEAKIWPGYGSYETDSFLEWCTDNVGSIQEEEDRTYMQSLYLWVYKARVNKCHAFYQCEDELAFYFGFATMTFFLLLLDYVYHLHKVADARRHVTTAPKSEPQRAEPEPPAEPQPKPEPEDKEEQRLLRAALAQDMRQIFQCYSRGPAFILDLDAVFVPLPL